MEVYYTRCLTEGHPCLVAFEYGSENIVVSQKLVENDVIPTRLIGWATPRPKSCTRPNPWPTCISSPSPSRGLITRCMFRKIQLGFIQDGPNPHGLLTLFTLAKEDMKI